MRQLTREWIDKAEGDFQAAQTLWAGANPLYDAVCFHAQQCVEKYLKAWLAENHLNFPRTHDLEVLARLCLPSFTELAQHLIGLRFLTSFAVEIRYPGSSAQESDALRCLRAAEDVRAEVRARLGS